MAKVTFRVDDKAAWDAYWKGFEKELIELYGEEAQRNKKKQKSIQKREDIPTSQPKPSTSFAASSKGNK